TILVDLAARISTDGTMPDGSQGLTGNVLIMAAEDDDSDTILPRLEEAGADLSRVFSLPHMTDENGEDQPPTLPDDIPAIEEVLLKHDIKLLIIDPLLAYLENVDANKDQQIRRALFKLGRLAAKTKTTILGMRHFNKGSGQKAIYRGNTSIAVIGYARIGMVVGKHPDDPNINVMAVAKTNLGEMPKALPYALQPN